MTEPRPAKGRSRSEADICFDGRMVDADSGFGRKLRQHKVTGDGLDDHLKRVIRNVVEHRGEGERGAQWAVRSDEAVLR
jgi:sulfite reductase (ferredoxin)